MSKYTVDLSVTVRLEDVSVWLSKEVESEADLHKAVMRKLHSKLGLLDIKGGLSGDDGYIIEITDLDIDDWAKE